MVGTEWIKPQYSRREIDLAGKAFIDINASALAREEARVKINNWRSSHSFPLNTLVMSLRKKAIAVDPGALIARRIKRLPSIRQKLERNSNMKLTQMQDLGGARAVLSTVSDVREVEQKLLEARHKHELIRHDDYISKPKESGYRGIHLVYKYASDKSKTYNNLRIELQIRSRLMHAWATAVETVGTFTKQSLKSSLGSDDYLRFFALMSAAIAYEEGEPFPPGVPEDVSSLFDEIRNLAEDLKIVERLEAYRIGLHAIEARINSGKYFLLQLDIENSILSITPYLDIRDATAAFDAVEAATSGENNEQVMWDSVLVTVDSVAGLRAAYPNYFLDTREFLERVRGIVEG